MANSSRFGRQLLRASQVVLHPWEYHGRARAAGQLATEPLSVAIDPAAGFARFADTDFDQLPDLIRLCERIFEEKHQQIKMSAAVGQRKKEYMVELVSDNDLIRHPQLVDFCLSRPVVAAVTNYLGTLLVLRRVGLLLSLPAPDDSDSRLFHLDPEDFRQVKIFVNVLDVQSEQGPLTFLPGNVSESVLKGIRQHEKATAVRNAEFRRWSDEEVLSHRAQFLRFHFPYATDANRFGKAHRGADPLAARMLVSRPGRTPHNGVWA